MTAEHDLIDAAMPDCVQRSLIKVQVDLVDRNTLSRLQLARFVQQATTIAGPRGKLLTPGPILNHIQAVAQMMRWFGPVNVEDYTAAEVARYFASRASGSHDGRPLDPAKPWQAAFAQTLRPLAPRTLRYHRLYCHRFLRDQFGIERADDLIELEEDRKGQYARNVSLDWITWDQVRQVREDLSLAERALLEALCTGPRSDVIRKLRVDQLRFQDGFAYYVLPPGGKWDEPRTIPFHHGDETMGAHVRQIMRRNKGQEFLFPNPSNLKEPMTGKQLNSLVATWGRRKRIKLCAADFRRTYLAYLMTTDCGEQFIAHVTGAHDMDPIYHLRREATTAKAQNRTFGQPVLTVKEVRPGEAPCIACGKPDNDVNDQICGACGNLLSETPLTTANAAAAKIVRQVSELLQVTGESHEERAHRAIAAARSNGGRP